MKLLSFLCVVLTLGLGGYWSWEIFAHPEHPKNPIPAFSSEPPSGTSGFHANTQNRLLEIADSDSKVRRVKDRAEVRSPAVDPEATLSEELLLARDNYLASHDLLRKEERLSEFLPGDGVNRMLRTYLLMGGVPEGKSADSRALREYWEKGLARSAPQAVERLARFLKEAPLDLHERSQTLTLLTWIYLKKPETQMGVEVALTDEVTRVGPTPHGLKTLSILLSLRSDPKFKTELEQKLESKFPDKGWGRHLASEGSQ